MITRSSLPKAYAPYQNMTLCSNTLVGGGHLVSLGEILPLLIGSGDAPMVWLQAPADQTGKKFIQLVAASVASHPAVSVVNDKDGLTVRVGVAAVLHVSQIDTQSAVVDLLDLRPIGLNIFGDRDSLTAGGATFSHNTFSGVGTLIAFGQ